ncbi:MAG: NfeD family protein [Oscillospiraceae bacterium]|nr:NfeD family protein [Oscillospiraceae bacterium]
MFPIPQPVIWLIAIIAFAIIEGVTATALVSIWFSVGALGALITSFITRNFWVQLAVFLIISCVVFALLRPLVKRHLTPRVEHTNAPRLVGEEAVVTETVDNLAGQGQASIKGQIWTARGVDNTPLTPGTRVTVVRIEGVKLIVRPAENG